MRIAHVTYHYQPIVGGQEVLTASLIRALDALGCEQVVFQADWGANGEGIIVVPKLPKPLRIGALDQYVFQLRLAAQKRRRLRECDVVIVQYANYYPAVAWHPNVIVLSHGVLWDRPTRRAHHHFIRYISKKTFHRTSVVANDTDYLREMGLRLRPGERLFEEVAPRKWLIPNCVDTELFRPTEPLAEFAGRRVILLARNVRYERGIHVAIEAMAGVAPRHPDASLVVAGSTWVKSYEEQCRALVRRHSLEHKVLFRGPVSREEMPRLYSSAAVNLVPSLLTEGTSLSALEGMACGAPTIASDVGGLPDLPCIHVPSGDAHALAEQVNRLLQDEPLRDAVADQQQLAVRSTFRMERWANAWKEVIRRHQRDALPAL
jgi:glycosyltransferase involved in cell wall biosynthesis